MDSRRNREIRPLVNHDVINLSVDGRRLSIRADTQPADVGLVLFILQGEQFFLFTDLTPEYLLFGNFGPIYFDWPRGPRPGSYRLTAIPITRQGRFGTPTTIQFSVVSQ